MFFASITAYLEFAF
jgi:hypothetical protein